MRKERTGFILLQLQLVLFLLLLLPCVVLAHFQSLVRSGSLLLSDLRLYRAARYSLSLVKSELSDQSVQVFLYGDPERDGSSMTLQCHQSNGHSMVSFYVKRGVLYRGIRKFGKDIGIVPNSDTDVLVKNWKLHKLSDREVEVVLTLEDRACGRRRTFREVLASLNGTVVQVS